MALVVEDVAGVGITRISRWIFNCYLIHDGGDGRAVVVDAGLPGLVDDLLPVLARLRIEPGSVGAIVATHGHTDHVGGAVELARRLDCEVHLPARDLAYLDGERPRAPGPRQVARIWPTLLDQPFDLEGVRRAGRNGQPGFGLGAMRWPGTPPQTDLADGHALPAAPDWQVLATPGHTDDSTAFWHERSGTLLSGDAVLSARGLAWCTPETADPEAARATEARLRALDVAHLLPGHGRPVFGDDVMAMACAPDARPGR